MQTLFIMSNTVMWGEIMYTGSSSRGIDMMLSQELQSGTSALFFVSIVIIGNFFLMNLFVGVIISTYNREKELLGRDFMLTAEQKKWKRKRMMMLQCQPKFEMKIPHSEWRQPFFYVA